MSSSPTDEYHLQGIRSTSGFPVPQASDLMARNSEAGTPNDHASEDRNDDGINQVNDNMNDNMNGNMNDTMNGNIIDMEINNNQANYQANYQANNEMNNESNNPGIHEGLSMSYDDDYPTDENSLSQKRLLEIMNNRVNFRYSYNDSSSFLRDVDIEDIVHTEHFEEDEDGDVVGDLVGNVVGRTVGNAGGNAVGDVVGNAVGVAFQQDHDLDFFDVNASTLSASTAEDGMSGRLRMTAGMASSSNSSSSAATPLGSRGSTHTSTLAGLYACIDENDEEESGHNYQGSARTAVSGSPSMANSSFSALTDEYFCDSTKRPSSRWTNAARRGPASPIREELPLPASSASRPPPDLSFPPGGFVHVRTFDANSGNNIGNSGNHSGNHSGNAVNGNNFGNNSGNSGNNSGNAGNAGNNNMAEMQQGYVDEEAALKYKRSSSASYCCSCCDWFSSSSRTVKVLVLVSVLLLIISVTSVTIGVLLEQERNVFRPQSAANATAAGTEDQEGPPGQGPPGQGSGDFSDDFSDDFSADFDQAPTAAPMLDSVTRTGDPTYAPSPFVTYAPTIMATFIKGEDPGRSEPFFLVPLPSQAPSPFPTTYYPTDVPTSGPSSNPSDASSLSPTYFPTTPPTYESPANTHNDQPQTHQITFFAAQDTYIDEKSPDENFSTKRNFKVDGQPTSISFLSFDTSSVHSFLRNSAGPAPTPRPTQQSELITPTFDLELLENLEPETDITSARLIRATLRLYAIVGSSTTPNGQGGGGTVVSLPGANQWREDSLTWNNVMNPPQANNNDSRDLINAATQYSIGSIVDGNVRRNTWYQLDVTRAFTNEILSSPPRTSGRDPDRRDSSAANRLQAGSEFVTFMITSNFADGVSYASRERNSGTVAPELILTFTTNGDDVDQSAFTWAPTSSPSTLSPTISPTYVPTTSSPTDSPTLKPQTNSPTISPTNTPTIVPTTSPIISPTGAPNNTPTRTPTNIPTKTPTKTPTNTPSKTPTKIPTKYPTVSPTKAPTISPTNLPTTEPTMDPTPEPTTFPTLDDTFPPSDEPTIEQTMSPTTTSTTKMPTNNPTTDEPTNNPTTETPTNNPTTDAPTNNPTTDAPTNNPTTDAPTNNPTTDAPTNNPTTDAPTNNPTTGAPTNNPTTGAPTNNPITGAPTNNPTTDAPTNNPTTDAPTKSPSVNPTNIPTKRPTTFQSTKGPSISPTIAPIKKPTLFPTGKPTTTPTTETLTETPTTNPTVGPTTNPTLMPNKQPTKIPISEQPTSLTSEPTTWFPTNSMTSIVPTDLLDPTRDPTQNPTDLQTPAPTVSKTSPGGSINFVPPGCLVSTDPDLPGLIGAIDDVNSVRVLFPVQDSYIRGGDYADENYGSSDILELKEASAESFTRKILIEFDLSTISSDIVNYNIVSTTLRLYVDSIDTDFSRAISMYRLPNLTEWDEHEITWNNFGTPVVEKAGPTFQVTWSDKEEWVDVDVSELIERNGANNLILILKNTSVATDASKCAFGSRETCYSPKLIVLTEPI